MPDTTNTNTAQPIEKLDSLETVLLKSIEELSANQEAIINHLESSNSNWTYTIIGFILSLFLPLCLFSYKWYKIRSILKPCNGIYLAFPKQVSDDNLTLKNALYYFEVITTFRTHRIVVREGISLLGFAEVQGEITMTSPEYNQGSGFYHHLHKDFDGITRFGFLELQIGKNNLYSHSSYQKNGQILSDALKWVKQNRNKEELAILKKDAIDKHDEELLKRKNEFNQRKK